MGGLICSVLAKNRRSAFTMPGTLVLSGVVWSDGQRPQKASMEAKVGPLSLDEAEHPLKSCLQQQNDGQTEDLADALMSLT